MVATVASIDMTLRLLGAAEFQAQMRNSGSVSEQTGARVKRSLEGIAVSSERVTRAAEGLNRSNSAINSIAISALRAETSVLALNKAFTLLGTAVGGLAGGVALNTFKNYADTATNIGNRLAAVIPVQADRAKIDERIFDTAQRTRASYEATANIYSRLSLSATTLGASQAQILKVTETTQKALAAGGATSSEAASIATQLTQALGSGRLAGDELKSIAENSPVLIQAIAKEFGVTVGALKDMGASGELTADRVFKAILKAGSEVDEVFARTKPSIAAGIVQIDNALTRYIGNVDKSIGATTALVGGLQFVAQNLNTIGDSAAIAIAALAGPLGSRLLGGAGSRVAAPFRQAGATAAAGVSAAAADATARVAARQAAQVAVVEAEQALKAFDNQPRFRQASADVQGAYTRQAAVVDKLRDASAKTAEREAAALLKRGEAENVVAQVSQTAANRVQSAKDTLAKRETALNDLIGKRPGLEQAAAAAGANVNRRQQGGYYDALYKVVEQRDKLAETNATIALTKRNVEALDEAIARARSSKTSGDFIPQAMARRQAEIGRLPGLTSQRDDQGRVLNEREKALVDVERRIGEAQTTEREKAGRKLADLDNQISRTRAGVAAQSDKVSDAEVRANETRIRSAETLSRKQAELDRAAIAAAAQRRAAEQAYSEANARLGGLAGQVGPSAAGQRAQAVEQIARAQGVLNTAYFAEQAALGASTQANLKNTASRIALTGALNAGKNSLGGLVSLLGGPLGAAITAGAVAYAGYEIYQARAAAQVEEHKQAVDRLIESTKRLNDLNKQGNVRTLRDQVDDQNNAKGSIRSAVDSRNALKDQLAAGLRRATPTGLYTQDSEGGMDASRPLTSIDTAAARAGVSIEDLRAKLDRLPPGSKEAALAARQLADAMLAAAQTDTGLSSVAAKIDDIAKAWEKSANAVDAYSKAQSTTNVPKFTDTPLDYDVITAPKFNAAPAIEAMKAQIKELKGDLLSLGDTDIDIRGLDTSREQIAQFAQDIVEARANAMGMLSGQTVVPEINDLVQAFGNGKISVESYATSLEEVGQKFPSFQPLIDSLVDSAQKALAANAQMAALGYSVKGLDGLVANILVKIGVSGKLPDISALAATEQAKADAALNKVEQGNRVLALKAAGKDVEAKVLESQQSNPALDVERANRAYAEQNRLNEQIAANKKAARGGGKKTKEQRDEDTLAKKLEELDQDTKVASLNDFDQKTVRFAQSAKVASDQIQQFIAAARSGDLSNIPPTMQEIYDKMRQLEGVKLGKQVLNDLFPGRLLAEQIESVRRAAANAPEIAANLELIEMSLRANNASEFSRGVSSAFTDMTKSVLNGTATMASALETFKKRIIDLALDAAFSPLQKMLSSVFSSAFSFGGGGGGDGAITGMTLYSSPIGPGLAKDGYVPGYAAGGFPADVSPSGLIRGPGTGTSDSILAVRADGKPLRISNGESIVTAKATREYRPLIEAMNRDALPAFARGGLIDQHAANQESAIRLASAPAMSPAAMARMGGGMKTEVNIVGGEKTGAETTMGPMGPRTDITIDKAVAAALMSGSATRGALKQIGSGRLTGR